MSDKIFIADKITLDQIKSIVDARLDVALSTRQENVLTTAHANRIDGNISSMATQASVDTVSTNVNTLVARPVGGDASQATLNTVSTNVNTLVARPAGATQASVDTVSTNVGSEANAASATGSVHAKIKDIRGITGINGQASGTTTVMGALRRIWESVGLAGDVAAVGGTTHAKLLNISNVIGINGQASGTTTVMGYLRRINETGGVQVVRSVQRGRTNILVNNATATIAISAVNPSRSLVFLDIIYDVIHTHTTHRSLSWFLNSTNIDIVITNDASSTTQRTLTWQVIEFH